MSMCTSVLIQLTHHRYGELQHDGVAANPMPGCHDNRDDRPRCKAVLHQPRMVIYNHHPG